jgi:hypothetical protein
MIALILLALNLVASYFIFICVDRDFIKTLNLLLAHLGRCCCAPGRPGSPPRRRSETCFIRQTDALSRFSNRHTGNLDRGALW